VRPTYRWEDTDTDRFHIRSAFSHYLNICYLLRDHTAPWIWVVSEQILFA
jgi:hypothetical protein